MNIIKQYDYRPGWKAIIMTLLFFGGCSGFMAYTAITNEEELVINGIIHLSVSAATVFYWVIAGLSFAFVLAGLALTVNRFTSVHRIAITEEGILLPNGIWKSGEHHVLFSDLTAIKNISVQKERFIYVYADGLKHTISASMLPSKRNFDEIEACLVKALESQGE